MPEPASFAAIPVRLRDWLRVPVAALVLAGIDLSTGVISSAWAAPAPFFAVLSILVTAAFACAISGHLARRDLTSLSAERHVLISAACLFVVGVLLSFGFLGWLVLLWSGRLLAGSRTAAAAAVQTMEPPRLRRRTTVLAAVIGIVCMLLLPLAAGAGSVPLVVLVMTGRIIAPFVFGFIHGLPYTTSERAEAV